jgi:hypothetical protein
MCGAKFAAGTAIAYRKASDHPIVGCPACDYGDLSGTSDEALGEHLRGLWALANNAVNMQARAGSVGRLLAQIDNAAAELGRRRAARVAA